MKIKLEQFLPSIGIKKTIFVSHDKPQYEFKSNIKNFVLVKHVEEIIILSVVTQINELRRFLHLLKAVITKLSLCWY